MHLQIHSGLGSNEPIFFIEARGAHGMAHVPEVELLTIGPALSPMFRTKQ